MVKRNSLGKNFIRKRKAQKKERLENSAVEKLFSL